MLPHRRHGHTTCEWLEAHAAGGLRVSRSATDTHGPLDHRVFLFFEFLQLLVYGTLLDLNLYEAVSARGPTPALAFLNVRACLLFDWLHRAGSA